MAIAALTVVGAVSLYHAAGQRQDEARARDELAQIKMIELRTAVASAYREVAIGLAFRPFGVVDGRELARLEEAADSSAETLIAAMTAEAQRPGPGSTEAEDFLESWASWSEAEYERMDKLFNLALVARYDGAVSQSPSSLATQWLIELGVVDELVTIVAVDVAAAGYALAAPDARPDDTYLEGAAALLPGRFPVFGPHEAPLEGSWVDLEAIEKHDAGAVQAMEDVIRGSLAWEFDQWMSDWPANASQSQPGSLADLVGDVASARARLLAITDARLDEAAAAADAAALAAQRRSLAAGAAGTLALLGATVGAAVSGRGLWRRTQLLERRVLTDPLTGVGSRALLTDRSDKLVGTPGLRHHAVVVVDLDRFKMINDTFGHAAGDVMLVRVACGLERVAEQVGVDETTVVRLGGDEFAITLHSASPIDLDLVRRHLDRLRREQVDLGDSRLEMGFSYGMAMATGSPDLASLLSGADLAAYQEKRARRTLLLTTDDVTVRPS